MNIIQAVHEQWSIWESQIGLYGMYDVQHRQIDVHLVNVGLPNNAFDYCLFQTTLMDGCQPHRHVAKQSIKYMVCYIRSQDHPIFCMSILTSSQ